jgi:hypothetical protein
MAFTKSFTQMQDEINDIFIQHHSDTRAEEVYTTESASCILVQLNDQIELKVLEDISVLTGDNNIWVDVHEGNINLLIAPENWIDDSKS